MTALASIAEEARLLLNDTYCCGLWKSTLPDSLLWEVDAEEKTVSLNGRPAEYGAPSWSWTSIEAPLLI
jgi:hypothetical protein